jgi:hypothetical protein
MISIKRVEDTKLNYDEILRNSPVAGEPRGMEFLQKFICSSQSNYVGYINGEIVCIYGLKPPTLLSNSKAYMWLLTTEALDRNKFEFIRHSEIVIENVLKEFEMIIGDTHVKDQRAFKWLKWLGAIYFNHEMTLVPFYITPESFKGRRRRRWQTQ